MWSLAMPSIVNSISISTIGTSTRYAIPLSDLQNSGEFDRTQKLTNERATVAFPFTPPARVA
eukprot:4181904-Pyramimonas_sp.AAC.1